MFLLKSKFPYQMNNASASKPDRHKEGEELSQPEMNKVKSKCWENYHVPDGSGGLEDVEVLEDVWDRHQPHGTQESEANPGPVQVDGDKGGWDCEVVHKGVELQHEPDLVWSRNELRKRNMNSI